MIHDSRGWQAGSDKELDLIAKFLRLRAFQRDPAQALHVIWSVLMDSLLLLTPLIERRPQVLC